MIKTDKVVYRARTPEEYDWLMEKLGEAGCMWAANAPPNYIVARDWWTDYKDDTCVIVKKQKIVRYMKYSDYIENPQYDSIEYIEVFDLMENEKKTITDEPSEQEDKQQKVKKIVYNKIAYNIEVYFE